MKKTISLIAAILILAALLCSCNEKEPEPVTPARLTYSPYGENISVELTDEETETVKEIFKRALPLPAGQMLSCGFGPDVSIEVDGIIYMIGSDSCGSLEVGLTSYDISDADIKVIHEIFEKYGGHFPCV